MDQEIMDFIARITTEGLLVTVVVCGPPIIISMVVGLTISLFQAVTQIQEATLTFVPKMIVIFGALAALGPWLGTTLMRFTQLCFEEFPRFMYQRDGQGMEELLRQAGVAINTQREMLIGALILVRTMPIVMLAPYLAGKLAPTEVKMGLGVLLTIVIWPLARETVGDDLPLTAGPFLMLMMKEVFIGLAIGFVSANVFWTVEMAGRLIDTVRGASMAEVMVPESGTRATPVGDMFYQLLIIIFLAMDGHHVFFKAYFFTFEKLPLHRGIPLGPELGPFIDYTIRLTGELLLVAVILASPVVAATFITDIVFGILNRVAPQLNAYFLSMPVKAMAGIIVILIAIDPFINRLKDFVVWSLSSIERTIELLTILPSY